MPNHRLSCVEFNDLWLFKKIHCLTGYYVLLRWNENAFMKFESHFWNIWTMFAFGIELIGHNIVRWLSNYLRWNIGELSDLLKIQIPVVIKLLLFISKDRVGVIAWCSTKKTNTTQAN